MHDHHNLPTPHHRGPRDFSHFKAGTGVVQTAAIVSLKTTCLRVHIIDFSNSNISYLLSAYCMPGMALNMSSINMRGTSPKKGSELHFAHTWSHIQNCAVRADLHSVFLGLCRATVLCVSETSNSQCSDFYL